MRTARHRMAVGPLIDRALAGCRCRRRSRSRRGDRGPDQAASRDGPAVRVPRRPAPPQDRARRPDARDHAGDRRAGLLLGHHRAEEGPRDLLDPAPGPGGPWPGGRRDRHRRYPAAVVGHHPDLVARPVRLPAGLPLHHRLQLGHRARPRLGRPWPRRLSDRPGSCRRGLAAGRGRYPPAHPVRLPHRLTAREELTTRTHFERG